MPTLYILPHPGENAVFFESSETLALAELSLCAQSLGALPASVRAESLGNLRYYALDLPAAPSPDDLLRLSRLSSAYALFEKTGDLLRPLPVDRRRVFGEDLSTILKYIGKTNPVFTRWLLQMATLSVPDCACPRVLDPIAGKGTTLYEAAMLGFPAAGVEVLKAPAHDAAVYFRKYLETARFKHTLKEEKRFGALCWDFRFAPDKDALKSGPGRLTIVCGDGADAARFFGKSCFDVICGDLPYGVQHGSVAANGPRARTPRALLAACLPGWREVLRPGGVAALSWNLYTLPRDAMIAEAEKAGFAVLTGGAYENLAHRVDSSILRDAVFLRRV